MWRPENAYERRAVEFVIKHNQFLDGSALLFIASISPFVVGGGVLSYNSAMSFCSYLTLTLPLNVWAYTWLSWSYIS